MRHILIILAISSAVFVSSCDFWPRELRPLAGSITDQVSGTTDVWLVGGDMVVINVAGSPLYREDQVALEAVATNIAEETIAFVEVPLESIAITFYEDALSEDQDSMREFIFLVTEGQPVLYPPIDMDASGPLTSGELQAAMGRSFESMTETKKSCVIEEAEIRAAAAGDPETLDPATMEGLSAQSWNMLDEYLKRLFLAQTIITEALFSCVNSQ